MLKTLLRKQLMEIFRSYFYNAKNNTRRSRAATVLFIVLYAVIMVGILGGIFTVLSLSLCASFASVGMSWLYFALTGLLAVFLGAFGSVFNTYSGLYLSRDNDLLLSLPVPVRCIMTARLLGVYLMGLMYSAVVIVPAVIVYWVVAPQSVASVVGSALMPLLISVIVLVLSCLLGWVVAKISQKLKNKSFITVLVSLVCIGAYYFFYYRAQTIVQELVTNAALYGARIRSAAYPVYLFGRAGEGDWLALLIVTAVVAAAFALTWWLLSRSFLRIATDTGHTARAVYHEQRAKVRSVSGALLGKELRRFGSSANYMLNCGLATLLLPVAAVALLIKGGWLAGMLVEVFGDTRSGVAAVLFASAVCMLASMNCMATPSVSLEGKNLWLVQSLPVAPWQVLCAKLRMHLLLTGIPALLCAGCAAVVIPGTVPERLLLVLAAAAFALLSALLGLAFGLKLPVLNWTNEIAPIKQNVGTLLAMLCGWLYGIAFGGLYMWVGWKLGAAAYLALASLVTALAAAGLYVWLRGRGSRILARL